MLTRSASILSRSSFADSTPITSLQSQVDGLVGHFVDEAANPTTLAAMVAGGFAYRLGRVGVVGLRVGAIHESPLRLASILAGLGSEVTAFELTNRTLVAVSGRAGLKPAPAEHFWAWDGEGGWGQGLLHSFITFGILKGAGHLAREENAVLQHVFQSGAMVAGHQAASLIGLAPRPEGSLAEQFLHAEATNLQMGAGMGLVHSVVPRIFAFERILDLSLRTFSSSNPSFSVQWARAGLPFRETVSEGKNHPQVLWMASMDDERGDPPDRGKIQRFLDWFRSEEPVEDKSEEAEEGKGPYRSILRRRPELDLATEQLLSEAEPHFEEALRWMENQLQIPPEVLRRFKILPALESAVIASQDPELPRYFSSPEASRLLIRIRTGHRQWLWSDHAGPSGRVLAIILSRAIPGSLGSSDIHRRIDDHRKFPENTLILRDIADELTRSFEKAVQNLGVQAFPTRSQKALDYPDFLSGEIRDVHHDFLRSPLLETALLQKLSSGKLEKRRDGLKDGDLEFYSERVPPFGEVRFGFRNTDKKMTQRTLLVSGMRALEWFFQHPDERMKNYAEKLYRDVGDRLILQDPGLQTEIEAVLSLYFPAAPESDSP